MLLCVHMHLIQVYSETWRLIKIKVWAFIDKINTDGALLLHHNMPEASLHSCATIQIKILLRELSESLK